MEALVELLSDRKDEHGTDDDPEDHWGLDELDELEGEDSDEEEEEEEEDEDVQDEEEEEQEQEEAREKLLKDTDQAEDEKVALEKDAEVDDLAKSLGDKLSLDKTT